MYAWADTRDASSSTEVQRSCAIGGLPREYVHSDENLVWRIVDVRSGRTRKATDGTRFRSVLEYVTLGHHRKFLEELLLPSVVTIVLLPTVRSGVLGFETPLSVEVLVPIAIVLLGGLLYVIFDKTYSVKFHQIRTVPISVLGYVLVSTPIPVGMYAVTTVVFGGEPAEWQTVASSVAAFTSIFATILILRLNSTVLAEQYDDRATFCSLVQEFGENIEAGRARYKTGRQADTPRSLRQLETDIVSSGTQLCNTLDGCKISDEQRLASELESWLDEFEHGTRVEKSRLLTENGEGDTRIMYVERALSVVC